MPNPVNAAIRPDALPRRARCGAFAFGAAFGLALAGSAPAQDPSLARFTALARSGPAHEIPEGGHLGLVQALRDAGNDAVVALVASHPDDQYVLPATYLRFAQGYRVVVLLATRGEGGQNIEGAETGDELAAIRSVETEACARRLGLVVEHLNLPDAGYSRSAEETLELWGRDETTRALARALRRVRPDLVMTTHHGAETHGHDLALLEVLPAACALAGSPRAAIDGLAPVAIDRLYRGVEPGEASWFALPVDDVDPDRGETWRDLAYAALSASHRSQAPFRLIEDFFAGAERYIGVPVPGGRADGPPRDLHEGLPDAFGLLAAGAEEVEALRRRFDVELPAARGNRLRLAGAALGLRDDFVRVCRPAGALDQARVRRRIDALERVALHALGLRVRVRSARPVAVPGEPLDFAVEIGSAGPVPIRGIELTGADDSEPIVVTPANMSRPQPWTIEARLPVPEDALRRDPLRDLFRRERFAMPFRVALRFSLELDGASRTELEIPAELPVAVRPGIELRVAPRSLLIPDGDDAVRFNVRLRRNTDRPLVDRLRIQLPPGFDAEPRSVELDLRTEPEQGYLFRLLLPSGLRPGPQPIRVRVGEHSARVELHRVPVSVPPDLRVGLIAGVDDAARTVLSQLGCELVVLSEAALPTRPLDDLDTIVVDIRALNHHAAARAEFNRLLDFAAAGGRLLVLYHKDSEFDPEQTGQRFFPRDLPLRIGKGRVTREDAPIELLLPDHPLLRSPNRIVAEDWDGWTQERGLYFPSSWDPAYRPLLRCADPGQPAEDGALLQAPTGRGEFVYCALALHRQLKTLHPGAVRLFANLVSHRRRGR
jgi:LmbE family N-acetylglucosaminyl deacetylase